MDFRLTSEQLELRKAARGFAEREFLNIARECDQEESFPLELLGKASRSGLVAIFIDKKYGG